MTSLLVRSTAPAEPEEPPVTTPRPRSYGVPWWAGVCGLDPAIDFDDWEVAARYTALACSVHVLGPDAVYRTSLLSRKGASPYFRMRAWLTDGPPTWEVASRRRFALRLACEHAPGLEMSDLLQVAQDFADVLAPG